MEQATLTYKGYSARPEYSTEDGVFFGRLLGINDLVSFESANEEGLEEEFHKAVDDYLTFCSEIGKQPEKRSEINARTLQVL